jgi:hypothetical protein
MKHQYDLFEKFPDGSSLWRACVIGLSTARHHMGVLAQRSSNRFYAMHVASGKIVPQDVSGGMLLAAKGTKRSSAAAA